MRYVQDKDLSESSKAFAEVTARLKKLEVQHEKSKRHEAEHRRNASEWKNKYNQCWKEYEYYKRTYGGDLFFCTSTTSVRTVMFFV